MSPSERGNERRARRRRPSTRRRASGPRSKPTPATRRPCDAPRAATRSAPTTPTTPCSGRWRSSCCKAPTEDPRELIRWTQTVVKHEALAVRRERERILSRPGRAPPEPGARGLGRADPEPRPTGPPERAERHEAIARSREALQALKPQELRALTLLAEGYSYDEIGEITGFSRDQGQPLPGRGPGALPPLPRRSEDGGRCAELRPLLSAFCDGEAERRRRSATLREHLRACAHCRATLRAYRAAPARRGGAGAGPAARAARCSTAPTTRSPGWRRASAAAAASPTRRSARSPRPAALAGAGVAALAKVAGDLRRHRRRRRRLRRDRASSRRRWLDPQHSRRAAIGRTARPVVAAAASDDSGGRLRNGTGARPAPEPDPVRNRTSGAGAVGRAGARPRPPKPRSRRAPNTRRRREPVAVAEASRPRATRRARPRAARRGSSGREACRERPPRRAGDPRRIARSSPRRSPRTGVSAAAGPPAGPRPRRGLRRRRTAGTPTTASGSTGSARRSPNRASRSRPPTTASATPPGTCWRLCAVTDRSVGHVGHGHDRQGPDPLSRPPGVYTVEVWLEGPSGDAAPRRARRCASTTPGPARRDRWPPLAGSPAAAAVVTIEHPAAPLPVSGIRGYAVSVDRGAGSAPCAGPDRCSPAETDLRGGVDGDTISLGALAEGVNVVRAVAVSGSGMRSLETGERGRPRRRDRARGDLARAPRRAGRTGRCG